MAAAGKSIAVIAEALGRSVDSVISKGNRLGLAAVADDDEGLKKKCLSSSFVIAVPKDLPSVEYQLRRLAGAIDALQSGSLSKVDVMRLRGMISGIKQYKEL